jgi:hypothetical protein
VDPESAVLFLTTFGVPFLFSTKFPCKQCVIERFRRKFGERKNRCVKKKTIVTVFMTKGSCAAVNEGLPLQIGNVLIFLLCKDRVSLQFAQAV